MIVKFLVPGPVKAKARHRSRVLPNGRPIHYSDRATRAYETAVGVYALEAGAGGRTNYTGPVKLGLVFRFRVPKSSSHREGDPHSERPDLDNCVKSILDGLNHVAFHDDSEVTELRVRKVWTAGEAGAEVEIEYSDDP